MAGGLFSRLKGRARDLTLASPLYRMATTAAVPEQLHAIPSDPWPGDSARGHALTQGTMRCAGQSFPADPPDWQPGGAHQMWRIYAQGFGWLRDLRALGGDSARRTARTLFQHWLEAFGSWVDALWTPPLIGSRLNALLGHYEFLTTGTPTEFRQRLHAQIALEGRTLHRIAAEPHAHGQPPMSAFHLLLTLRGQIQCGIALHDTDMLTAGLDALLRALPQLITPDGGSRTRAPHLHLHSLRALIDVRNALRGGAHGVPAELAQTIQKMAPALRFFRHGDGALALFNGSREEDTLLIERALTLSEAKGRTGKSLPHSGFERLSQGRTLVIMDCGAAPGSPDDREAHAGALSFEFSVGRERVLTNCGGPLAPDVAAWRTALAATAAHTALIVADTNSSEVQPQGGIGPRRATVRCARTQEDDMIRLCAQHDGYMPGLMVTHQRHLTLASDGDLLQGEDVVSGTGTHLLAIRFHLHPDVQFSLIQNNQAALLRLPSGQGWRLTSLAGPLRSEESIYCGREEPRKCRQLVISTPASPPETRLGWTLKREG